MQGPLAAMQQAFWTYLRGSHETAGADLLAHVRGTDSAPATARLRIYHAMYLRRLLDALRADFPKLAAWLGEPVFNEIATAYVRACASRDPEIGRMGDGLADYLAERARNGADMPYAWADMAAFELARRAVQLAADAQPAAVQVLSQFDAGRLAQVCLRPVPALRLVRARYNVASVWQRIETAPGVAAFAHVKGASMRQRRKATTRGAALAQAQALPAFHHAWAVWRSDERILHAALSPEEARAVERFLTGVTLADVCQSFANTADPIQAAFGVIGTWFQDGWVLSATHKS